MVIQCCKSDIAVNLVTFGLARICADVAVEHGRVIVQVKCQFGVIEIRIFLNGFVIAAG